MRPSGAQQRVLCISGLLNTSRAFPSSTLTVSSANWATTGLNFPSMKANRRPFGAQVIAPSQSPAWALVTKRNSVPSDFISQISRPITARTLEPLRRKATCDPSGETAGNQASAARNLGLPPRMEIFQIVRGCPGDSFDVKSKCELSGNQLLGDSLNSVGSGDR